MSIAAITFNNCSDENLMLGKLGKYRLAHDAWDVIGFQVLFCPTKQALLWCLEVVKSSDWEVFIVEIGHFYVKNRGSLSRVVSFLQPSSISLPSSTLLFSTSFSTSC